MFISTHIKKLARMIEKEASSILKGTDITVGYTNYLMCLYKEDGLTQTALQNDVGFEHPTVVRALDRMARDGLIERRPNPNDRRSFLIFLSEKARSNQKTVMKAGKLLNQKMSLGFTQEELMNLETYLQRMAKNLEKMD